MSPEPPHFYEVVIACAAVVIGCIVACWAAWQARQSGNWLLYVVAAGATLFVAGIVGQQVPRSDGAGSVWTASIVIPLTGLAVSGVAIAGLLILLVGLSLVLFFERVVPEEARWRPPPQGALEDDDTV